MPDLSPRAILAALTQDVVDALADRLPLGQPLDPHDLDAAADAIMAAMGRRRYEDLITALRLIQEEGQHG